MSALIVAVKFDASSMPSFLTVEKPGSVNVRVYTPGRRLSILYAPFASVVADRTCSINAGLAASTVTPGSTAPVASFTTPANALCARAAVGSASSRASMPTDTKVRLIIRVSLRGTVRAQAYITVNGQTDGRNVEPVGCGGLDQKLGLDGCLSGDF